jgi:hypothetical protein
MPDGKLKYVTLEEAAEIMKQTIVGTRLNIKKGELFAYIYHPCLSSCPSFKLSSFGFGSNPAIFEIFDSTPSLASFFDQETLDDYCRLVPPLSWLNGKVSCHKIKVIDINGLPPTSENPYRTLSKTDGCIEPGGVFHMRHGWEFKEKDILLDIEEVQRFREEDNDITQIGNDSISESRPGKITISTPLLAPITSINPDNSFKKGGAFWIIRFEGKEFKPIKHVDGLQYIAILLDRPETSISCQDLYQSKGGPPLETTLENEVIGRDLRIRGFTPQPIGNIKKQYLKEEYGDLKQRLSISSLEEQEDIREKMTKLESYLKKRERNFADPNDKKAQINISKCLKTAYKVIREANMEVLEKHLRDNIRPDRAFGLRYTGSITWEIII